MARVRPREDVQLLQSHKPQQNPLFRFGVDIESVGEDGKTNLHAAAMFSDPEKVIQASVLWGTGLRKFFKVWVFLPSACYEFLSLSQLKT
jgi:hypothetical protein